MPVANFEHFKLLWERVQTKYSNKNSEEISFENLEEIELKDDEVLSTSDLSKIKKKFIDKIEDYPTTINLPQSIYFKLFSYVDIKGFGDLINISVEEIVAKVERESQSGNYDFEEVGFIGREDELNQLSNFILAKGKNIFALYGIPMIGKTWLIEQFVKIGKEDVLKQFQIEIIKLNPIPGDLKKAKEDLDLKNTVLDKFMGIGVPTLVVVQNFEEVLDWKGDKNKYHLIKKEYKQLQNTLKILRENPSIKIILESRFHIKFKSFFSNTRNVQYLKNFNLKGVKKELFWKFYKKRKVSKRDFDKLCKNFDNHTALLALAFNDRELYEDNLSEAAYSPTDASIDLWEKVDSIIDRLDEVEVWILSCLTFLQQPIKEVELIEGLSQVPELSKVSDLRNYLFSLKKKLLTNTLKGHYDLNPYVREVCFTFLNNNQRSKINKIARSPFFREFGRIPKYDIIKQAVERYDFMYLFNLGKKLRRERNYRAALYAFESGLLIDPKKENVLTEIAIVYKKQKKYEIALNYLNDGLEYVRGDDEKIRNEIGICEKMMGNLNKAEVTFTKLVKEKKHLPAFTELAILYREKEELNEAIILLEKARALSPKDTKILNELGISYLKNGNYNEAADILTQSIALGNKFSYSVLCRTYQKQNKIKLAYDIAQEGMKTHGWDKRILTIEFNKLKKIVQNMKKVFLSYSHKDEDIKENLDVFLSTLKRSNKIDTWNDRKILGGQNWDNVIKKELEEADVILLLISAYFINSNYIWNVELAKAIDKHNKGEAIVIPIFCKPCDFKDTPFQSIQGYPKDAKFITTYANRDLAYAEVVKGIRAAIEN